jgi:hypothetical protein
MIFFGSDAEKRAAVFHPAQFHERSQADGADANRRIRSHPVHFGNFFGGECGAAGCFGQRFERLLGAARPCPKHQQTRQERIEPIDSAGEQRRGFSGLGLIRKA